MTSDTAPFIRAIIYADLFDYPLTSREVWRFATGGGKVTRTSFDSFVTNPPAAISVQAGYFQLSGRDLVSLRKKRQRIGKEKMLLANIAATVLSRIPTIRCIGVSGGLSLLNTEQHDDIDFFIITTPGSVWTTRLLVYGLLELMGLRRKRGVVDAKDTICVNMYLDSAALQFPKNRHDLFTAHEIAQLVPLVNKAHTYEKFLSSNQWVKKFLPNVAQGDGHAGAETHNPNRSLRWVENLLRKLQFWYMKKHITREIISDTVLAFHPFDYRKRTLSLFEKRVAAYEKI